MVGLERLHQHPAAARAAAGPPGHLRDQLKRPLGGAEVGQVQRRVGIDHADERDVRKIQSLGDHLRPQQDADRAVAKPLERLAVRAGVAHRVGVHPQASKPGKRARTSTSSFCVPRPVKRSPSKLQAAQRSGSAWR